MYILWHGVKYGVECHVNCMSGYGRWSVQGDPAPHLKAGDVGENA